MDKDHKLGGSKRLGIVYLFKGMIIALLLAMSMPGRAAVDVSSSVSGWIGALHQRLTQLDADYPGELGVYVKDLESGRALSFRGEESWYLASGIKIPVAIEVMRCIQNGELSLDTMVELKASDYVDGAGGTNWKAPGTLLSVGHLLDQMLIYSDNTASDILIRLVGVERVNRLARELAPDGLGDITSLADVRRHAYSGFHQAAFGLEGEEFFALRNQADPAKRIETLARILDVSTGDFVMTDLDSAFDAYYATNLNAGRLSAFGALLETLADGEALQPESTAYLLNVLRRVETGEQRIKAGLTESVSFAHKTGTQHARACDFGIATSSSGKGEKQVVIAACSRGDVPADQAEAALRAIGEAIQGSGVMLTGE